MLTAGVSPSFVNQATNYFQQRQADLQQLGKDLKAGDLNAAQQDFNAIQTLAENGPLANGNAFKVTAAGFLRHRSGSSIRGPRWRAAGLCATAKNFPSPPTP